MNNPKKGGKTATTEKSAVIASNEELLNQEAEIAVSNLLNSEPLEVLDNEILAERKLKALAEATAKGEQLNRLKGERNKLLSWGFGETEQKAKIVLTGDGEFSTSNTILIAKCKSYLVELFTARIEELQAEILDFRV
jgi:hypothetical protein